MARRGRRVRTLARTPRSGRLSAPGTCQFSARAESDLDKILLRIARDNRTAALELVARIEGHCREHLAAFPLAGVARPKLGRDIRMSIAPPYLILYRPTRDGVRIVRIVHGARRLTRGMVG
ncbi:MAG: type II toxin-antitoxin system RelE/ParE family toxin [Hyphomonadaceae bacterium]|nr:type II toxin-antitoxin system RelE/ParE family toxin [Hyphomonadaceae bacterium]